MNGHSQGTRRCTGTLRTPRCGALVPGSVPARPRPPAHEGQRRQSWRNHGAFLPGPLRRPSRPTSARARRGFRAGASQGRERRQQDGLPRERSAGRTYRANGVTQRKPTMARTDEVAGAVRSPHGSRGAVTEQPGRLTGQKRDTGGSPVTPRDPPGCSSSGVAFGLPLPLSRLIPFSRALPGVLGGGCKEFMREQTGARWDPKGFLRAGALQGSKSPKGGQELCLQRYLEALARPDPACHTGV